MSDCSKHGPDTAGDIWPVPSILCAVGGRRWGSYDLLDLFVPLLLGHVNDDTPILPFPPHSSHWTYPSEFCLVLTGLMCQPPLNICIILVCLTGLPWWLSSKESTCSAGVSDDAGLIPGSGRSPGGGHGNPLQYSCLENPMDRGACGLQSIRVAKSRTQLERPSTCACTVCLKNVFFI